MRIRWRDLIAVVKLRWNIAVVEARLPLLRVSLTDYDRDVILHLLARMEGGRDLIVALLAPD